MLRRLFSMNLLLTGARLSGAAAGFISQLLLAKALGADDLGIFFAASSMAAILGLAAAQGYPGIASRFISRYRERERPRWLAAFLFQASREAFLVAIGTAIVLGVVASCWPDVAWDSRMAFVVAAASVPAFMSLSLFGAFAGAIRRFSLSLVPELLLRPFLFLGAVWAFTANQVPLSASQAVTLLALITCVLALAQYVGVRGRLPIARAAGGSRLTAAWRGEAWPLLVVLLFTSFFSDLAILAEAPFLPASDVAAFGVCMKIAMIIGFGVQVAHQVALPELSDAYARRDLLGVRAILLRSAYFPVGFCLAALVLAIFFGDQVLLLFGAEFVHAHTALVVVIACQLVRALAGPTPSLLTLEGAQRTNFVICACSCLLLVAASAVLDGRYGLIGGIIAVGLTYMFWIVAAGVALYRLGAYRADLPSLLFSRPAALRGALHGAASRATG